MLREERPGVLVGVCHLAPGLLPDLAGSRPPSRRDPATVDVGQPIVGDAPHAAARSKARTGNRLNSSRQLTGYTSSIECNRRRLETTSASRLSRRRSQGHTIPYRRS